MLRHIRLVHTGTTHTETGMRTREVLQDSRALTLWFEALRVRSRCTTARVCTSVHSTNMQSRSGSSVHSSECLHSVYACLSQCLCAVRTYDHVYTLLFFSNHNLIACRDTKACSTQKEKPVVCLFLVMVCAVYKVCHCFWSMVCVVCEESGDSICVVCARRFSCCICSKKSTHISTL